MFVNDAAMESYKRSTINAVEQKHYKVLDSQKYFGNLWGNGNKCDAVISLLIEADKFNDKVRRDFKELLNVDKPFKGWNVDFPTTVIQVYPEGFFEIKGEIKEKIEESHEEYFLLDEIAKRNKFNFHLANYYMIIKAEVNSTGITSFDPRCN
jgi:hypothetical protein